MREAQFVESSQGNGRGLYCSSAKQSEMDGENKDAKGIVCSFICLAMCLSVGRAEEACIESTGEVKPMC